MKDLLGKEHDCYKIHTLLTKSISAYPRGRGGGGGGGLILICALGNCRYYGDNGMVQYSISYWAAKQHFFLVKSVRGPIWKWQQTLAWLFNPKQIFDG